MIRKYMMSEKFKPLKQLMTGSMLAQLITIVVAPISTRLYSAEELGVYTLLLTITSMFGPVISGKYDMSIVSAKSENEVMELITGSMLFSFVFLGAITIGYSYYLSYNPEIFIEVGWFAYIVIVLLLIRAFTNILTSYNNRHKEYKTIASVYVIRNAVQNLGLVIFGILNFGSKGLLFSQLIGSLFGLKRQGIHLYNNRKYLKNVNMRGIKKVLIKYKNQPVYSMPAHFVSSSSYSLLNFFISGLFGLSVFGYYSMSYRILGLPLNLVSMNVSKVFFQRASEEKNMKGHYSKALKQMTLFLTIIAFPMVLILMIFAPSLFELAFGEGWYISGVYVRILAPMFGIRMIVSALTPALIVSGKQKFELIIQFLFILTSLLAFGICKVFIFDIYVFLTIITVVYSIIYIILYFTIYKLSK